MPTILNISIGSGAKIVLSWMFLWMLFDRPALSQEFVRHGEVTDVQGNSIKVRLAPAYAVSLGTKGTLYTQVTIGGKTEELARADVSVDGIDSGIITVIVTRSGASFSASTDMYVRFDKVRKKLLRGTLLIKSNRDGSSITVDGEGWGFAPAQKSLPPGRHLVRVAAPGYVPQQLNVSVAAGKLAVKSFSLVPVERRGTLTVYSDPGGALVTVNGESWGLSPVDRDNLQPGQYQIHLELLDYLPLDTTVTVSVNTSNEGVFPLKRKTFSTTTLIVRVNIDSQLAINTQVVDTLRGGITKKLTVPADKNLSFLEAIALEGDGYDSETVLLEPGGRVTKVFTLAVPTREGVLSIKSEPVGIAVEVSGANGFLLRDTTDSDIPLRPGIYSLTFSKEGYETQKKSVEIASELRSPMNVRLVELRFQNSVGIQFERIKRGTFMMGSEKGEEDERPYHGVSLTNDFFISAHEVTQSQYMEVMGLNPSSFPGGGKLPVERVSWFDAISFANQLSVLEGLQECYTEVGEAYGSPYQCPGYRLPTEAEWEYVARTSLDQDVESLVNQIQIGVTAWMLENSENRTHTVGQKKPNKWGLYDLEGNVWEWVHDVYAEDYKGAYSSENPTGPLSGPKRVLRGGSWRSPIAKMYVTNRAGNLPVGKSKDIGFRLVRSVK
ncbi:MAG: hypothetical protein BMS9Abin05_2522 [Rhodothermia bacterium]|nr:MAG: hypothetical protein BMS9Abin05_2522 [Rhodothermia bacterium]